MVARAYQPRSPSLSLDQQAARIRLAFPKFRVRRKDGELVIHGAIQPSEGSRSYKIRLTYRCGHHPRVYVESPQLVNNIKGEAPPHRFVESGNPLCLYYNKGWEWSSRQAIADTIIPWTSEYLLFYELWLATGEWLGGGMAHDTAKAVSPNRLDGEQPRQGGDLHAPVRHQ